MTDKNKAILRALAEKALHAEGVSFDGGAYLAAAHPAAVLALLDENARLCREREAAQRERDETHYDAYRIVQQRLAAVQAAGYARGVRDASCFYADSGANIDAYAAILALLPKEPTP
jgi:hypothetical protein